MNSSRIIPHRTGGSHESPGSPQEGHLYVVALILLTAAACGRSKIVGTYCDGYGTECYTFRPNGTVLISEMGMGTAAVELKYEVDGDKVRILLAPQGGASLALTMLKDGSIQGPEGIKLTKHIVAAIATPDILQARMAANEANAVSSLRTLNATAVVYGAVYTHGYPPALENLGPPRTGQGNEDGANLIDATLASRKKSGYVFFYSAVRLKTSAIPLGYTINGDPAAAGTTDTRHFYTDQTGIIRFKIGGPADAHSRPLQ